MADTLSIPSHVGIILDGNRRWAKKQGLTTLEGHRKGAENFKDIAMYAFDKGIKNVSAYVFSTDNWKRTEEEVGYLMDLVLKAVDKYLGEFHERGIKIVILGRREGLRQKVIDALTKTEQKTAHNTAGTLALCFNYNGQDEVVDAVNMLVQSNQNISTDSISSNLYYPDIPNVDLIIRTSGEQRLSGYMLWRAAYAELYFTNIFWPEFSKSDFDDALTDFDNRNRRYGK